MVEVMKISPEQFQKLMENNPVDGVLVTTSIIRVKGLG